MIAVISQLSSLLGTKGSEGWVGTKRGDFLLGRKFPGSKSRQSDGTF